MLGRPQNVEPLLESLERSTQLTHRVLFMVTPHDYKQIVACEATGCTVLPVPGKSHQYPSKMNAGFHASDQEFVFLGADDIEFLPGWDERSLETAEATNAGVIGLNDLANSACRSGVFSTHPLVRRSYINDFGGCLEGPPHMLSMAYDHNFSERELCAIAKSRGQWAFNRSAQIQHKHPAWGTAENDATYQKGMRRFARDRQIFFRRACKWGAVGLTPLERSKTRFR